MGTCKTKSEILFFEKYAEKRYNIIMYFNAYIYVLLFFCLLVNGEAYSQEVVVSPPERFFVERAREDLERQLVKSVDRMLQEENTDGESTSLSLASASADLSLLEGKGNDPFLFIKVTFFTTNPLSMSKQIYVSTQVRRLLESFDGLKLDQNFQIEYALTNIESESTEGYLSAFTRYFEDSWWSTSMVLALLFLTGWLLSRKRNEQSSFPWCRPKNVVHAAYSDSEGKDRSLANETNENLDQDWQDCIATPFQMGQLKLGMRQSEKYHLQSSSSGNFRGDFKELLASLRQRESQLKAEKKLVK